MKKVMRKSLHNLSIERCQIATRLNYNINTNHIGIGNEHNKRSVKRYKRDLKYKTLHSISIEGCQYNTVIDYNLNTKHIGIGTKHSWKFKYQEKYKKNGRTNELHRNYYQNNEKEHMRKKIRGRDYQRVKKEIPIGHELHHLWYSEEYDRKSFTIISFEEHIEIHR